MNVRPELYTDFTPSTDRRSLGNLLLENIPAIPSPLSQKVDAYLQTDHCTALGWLSDGSDLLVSTRYAETPQVHRLSKAGGTLETLTFFEEPIQMASPNPHSPEKGFLFLKDVGGSEYYQLLYFNCQDQSVRALTGGQSKTDFYCWHPFKQQVIFTSNHQNEVDYHFYLQDLEGDQEAQCILAEPGYWYPLDWSPDGRRLLVGKYHSINESYLYELDLDTKELTLIREGEDPAIAYRTGVYSLDGQTIYLASDYQSQFQQLKSYHRQEGTFEHLITDIHWDLFSLQRAPQSDQLAFICNVDGVSQLYFWDPQRREYHRAETLPYGIIQNMHWHPQRPELALTIDRPDAPADVYVLNTQQEKVEQWTQSKVGRLVPEACVVPNLIHYPTFDHCQEEQERKIPAFYYRPKRATSPSPVLIYIHGGPESQYRPNFNPTFQYYLEELGVAVLAPNVRGSLGYGKDFLKLDNGYKREDSVRDIGCLLDWIERQPELDSTRVAVFGGSYGGYMVLASMTHYTPRLRCGVDIVGISNFITFLENTKSYRRDLRRVEYGDERDPAMRQHLSQISPLTNAHKIQRPMLIVQGLNDPRVPVGEAEQMVQAIRDNGGEAWYLLAKDEGHGFKKKFNQDYFTKVVMLFLQKFLLP
ncbi:MAG: prolyl oligopeptidase family serine peptidase [Bacteroidota bacterium]